jgi:hypothetical protein
MATPTPLPDRPSMASMRKQAKALARAITAGEPAALSRAQAELTDLNPPVSFRDAQLVLVREYGFDGWADLQHEVLVRSGQGLEWAAVQAERAIHEDDIHGLQALLRDYAGLATWHHADGYGLLDLSASYAMDNRGPVHEERLSHVRCAELLIDSPARSSNRRCGSTHSARGHRTCCTSLPARMFCRRPSPCWPGSETRKRC